MGGDLDPTGGAYWDYTLGGISNDVKAFVTEIKEQTGREKVSYVGYSLGNMQMFYALATDDGWWANNLHKFVAIAPCAIANVQV